jgi:hypothetical protein
MTIVHLDLVVRKIREQLVREQLANSSQSLRPLSINKGHATTDVGRPRASADLLEHAARGANPIRAPECSSPAIMSNSLFHVRRKQP